MISAYISLNKTCKRPKAHGKMLNSISHQENANHNHNSTRMGTIQKKDDSKYC